MTRMPPAGAAPVVLVAAAVVLVGCTPAQETWAADACNIHASWVSAERPATDVDRVVRSLRDIDLENGDAPVARATTAFVTAATSGSSAAILAASTRFADACVEDGWEPPEG